MSMSFEHGTDCFEVEAFLRRNEASKLFKVRHKVTGRLYCMEVVPRKNVLRAPTSARVQEAQGGLSKFWVNLKFTFQTNSKLYYILEHIGETTLGTLYEENRPFTEDLVIFYASEIVMALEELHSNGLLYGELDLEKILIDNTGHVVLWRSFWGKKYWTRQECVCQINGFERENPCENSHEKLTERKVKIDFQLLGLIVLQLFSQDKLTSLLNNKTSKQERLLRLVSKPDFLPSTLSVFGRDLVTRLLKGQFYNGQHVRSHPFFSGVNWKMVKARLSTPPGITRKLFHPPRLRKSSSEAYMRPQTPVQVDENYLYPPYQVRPSSSPLQYPSTRVGHGTFTDESLGASYPQYSSHSPPRRLRSTLSSPDLSTFGQDMNESQWTRDQYPYFTGIPRDRSSYSQFNPVGSSNRYGLSHSMSDLSNIDNYDAFEPTSRLYGRSRTSSLTGLTGGRHDEYHSPPPLITHRSFPPSNSEYMERTDARNRSPDYDYRSVRIQDRNGYGSPSNTYLHQGHNYLNNSSSNGSPSVYRTEARYARDFSHLAKEDFRFGGHILHRSSSDLHSNSRPSGESYYSTSTDNAREGFGGFTTLHRSRSCSDLTASDNEESGSNSQRLTPSSASERRKNYPLAQIPIPSFEEFKRRNPTQSVEEDLKKLGRKKEDFHPPNVHTNDKEVEFKEKKASSKDKIRSTNFLTSKYSLRERRGSKDSAKSRSDPSGSTREKGSENGKESYYSQNDVIHNLMLKYGLYERSEKKKEASNNRKKERNINSAKTDELDFRMNSKKGSEKSVENDKSDGHPEGNVRGPRSGRRASAVHHREAPKLTHKSYSSLTPSTALQLATENSCAGGQSTDTINNLKFNGAKDEENRTTTSEDLSPRSRIRKDELKSKLFDSTSQNKPEITIADVYKSTRHRKSLTPEALDSIAAQRLAKNDKDLSDEKESEKAQKSSKTLWAAAKDRLKLRKSPNNSPFLKRKEKGEVKTENGCDSEQNEEQIERPLSSLSEEKVDTELNKRRLSTKEDLNKLKFARDFAKEDAVAKRKISTDSSSQGQLRKNGVHSSLLSITSSLYSTDIDLDDSGSWHSELDGSESIRSGNRKRWESFHSNISADSGSAHMYEFETDSIAAELENVQAQEQQISENRKKSDIEVERTDSGIGGDIGVDHNYKRSWEDIVLKSSKHWSIVAASARHWQDLAKKNKKSKEIASKRMKNVAPAITEDMVECIDCQKFYVPEDRSGQDMPPGTSNSTDPSLCTKCRERRVERKEAIIEVVQTEINYGNDLQILKEEFYSPLQSGGILQPDNLAEIFLNLQELVEVSTKFSRRLQNGLEVSVSKGDEEFSHVNVGSIFLESVDLFQSYEIYCSKQNSASTLLESLQKKNELLKIFLNVTCRENPKCRKMDLNSFLLAPVQRIMKYPLLLSRIRKATPRRNPDREKLMQAQKKIEDQLNRINALNSSVEPKQRRYRGSGHLGRSDSLDKLQMKKMASEILNWTMSELHLLMHGVFEVVIHEFTSSSGGWNRRTSKRAVDIFMLFCVRGLSEPATIDSDEDNTLEEPFFPSESEATDAALVMLRKKMNGKYTLFKEPLSLEACVICKDSEHKDSFEIINMSRETYVFKAKGNKECKKWLKHLRLQAKDLGMWKKRRNGLPNIMIKNI